jgi:hypothetical protein
MRFDVIVIGGGAAGLFCAIEAGKRGRKTLVIEHNAEVGRKILISGGGRCNFTNIHTAPENFISQNPHFCKSALATYTPPDFVALVKRHNIAFYEKKLGQLFCRESSRPIVDMLLAEAKAAKVKILTSCSVRAVSKNKDYTVETSQGNFGCASLVIATGGLSFPKIGATAFGYELAKQFGLRIEPTRPALVPLVFGKQNSSALAGISIDSLASAGKHSFRENLLFTHRGLSGPAILQISTYWQTGEAVKIDLLPDIGAEDIFQNAVTSKKNLGNYLNRFLPARFVENHFTADLLQKQAGQLSHKEQVEIARQLKNWRAVFTDTEGYHKAEVTAGGVSTAELSSKTMESKKTPGLYFIGEVVDVTGWLGGYNFQWAWASGYAAGQAV